MDTRRTLPWERDPVNYARLRTTFNVTFLVTMIVLLSALALAYATVPGFTETLDRAMEFITRRPLYNPAPTINV